MAENITAPFQTFDEYGQSNYTPISKGDSVFEPTILGYKDSSGNIWDSPPRVIDDYGTWSTPNLLLSSTVANDPHIQSLGLAIDPAKAQALYDLKQNNPSEFYKQVSGQLNDRIYENWRENQGGWNADLNTQLEALKELDPASYYSAKLTDLGRQVGWNIGQNTSDRNEPTIAQIQALIPEAQKAGLSADQINSLVGSSVNTANLQNQERIANRAASGGNYWTENLIGALKVGGLALGAYGIDQALAAGLAGAQSAGTGLTTGTGGSSGLLNAGAGGAFSPAGAMATQSAAGLGGAGTGIIEGLVPSSIGMGGTAGAGSLAGITGSQLAAGLGGANLGTGLTADQLAAYEAGGSNPAGSSFSDVLSAANKARQAVGIGSSIAKMVGGGNSGQAGGINLGNLANALRNQNTFNPINLQQIQPKNPFFGSTEGSLGGEGVYDVSGSMANALRKRNYGIS